MSKYNKHCPTKIYYYTKINIIKTLKLTNIIFKKTKSKTRVKTSNSKHRSMLSGFRAPEGTEEGNGEGNGERERGKGTGKGNPMNI